MVGVFNFFSLDFLALECFQDASERYYTSVILWSVMPLAWATVIVVTYVYRMSFLAVTQESKAYRRQQAHTIKSQHVWALLLLTYVVLPPVAMKQFQSLDCIPFAYDGGSYLRVDTIIDCNSDTYVKFRSFVIIVIIVYQMIPILWFYLLFSRRGELNPSVSSSDPELAIYIRDKDTNLAPIRFLFDSYKVDHWWFEVAEMYRRIVFVSIIPLTSNVKATRASLGCVLGVVSMLYYREENPFRRDFTNIIAYVAQAAIFMTYYAALSIESDTMISFGMSDLGVGIFLVIINLSVMGLLLLVSYQRLEEETRRKALKQAKVNH
jgi:hypothetical protein